MTFPEAVTYLLNGETGEMIHGKNSRESDKKESMTRTQEDKQNRISRAEFGNIGVKGDSESESESCFAGEADKDSSIEERKPLRPPERNDNMKRVYAYLMQKRFIARDVISFFARQGTLYESKEHHNAVFVGTDIEGNPRHIHKKGTYSEGISFRMNEEGSIPLYGFGYTGAGNILYVFEAPIDFLSFLTLYPKDWQENSYIVLNGVAEHAMLQMLHDHTNLNTVVLCLDHDPAGIEACGRLSEILRSYKITKIKMLQSTYKDWNEDLKAIHGVRPIPAEEHPKIIACHEWIGKIKEISNVVNLKLATPENMQHYYDGIQTALKKGYDSEHLETAFDGAGLLLSAVTVKCVERYGKELGKETNIDGILKHLEQRYRPHKDKGNLRTRIRNLQESFEEAFKASKMDFSQKENIEFAAKKCMCLALECVKAHLFIVVDLREQQMAKEKSITFAEREADGEGTMEITRSTEERGQELSCSQ